MLEKNLPPQEEEEWVHEFNPDFLPEQDLEIEEQEEEAEEEEEEEEAIEYQPPEPIGPMMRVPGGWTRRYRLFDGSEAICWEIEHPGDPPAQPGPSNNEMPWPHPSTAPASLVGVTIPIPRGPSTNQDDSDDDDNDNE